MSEWTDAKRTRKPLQTQLISGSYYNITRPRPQTPTGTRNAYANKCLMDFGFMKSNAVDRVKRKHASALQYNTVMDSQADSDDDPLLPGSCHLNGNDSTAHRPNKRRRSTALFAHDEPASSDPPSSPVPQSARLDFNTPTGRRTRTQAGEFDVPSSLSYERYIYRHWDDDDTPSKVVKFCIYTELSPPPSSFCARSTSSPTKEGPFDVLTPLTRSRGMLTPPHSRYEPRRDLDSSPFEVSPDANLARQDLRLPLANMEPTLIPTPQARQRSVESRLDVSQDNGRRGRSISRTASVESRPDTPSIWHDAMESLDPSQEIVRLDTIEDSQDQEMFDTLSPRPCVVSRTTAPSQHFSWVNADDYSLMDTLLPPDYRSSQYDLAHTTASSDDNTLSQTCRAPPSLSSSPLSAERKRPAGERDDEPEKRQRNF